MNREDRRAVLAVARVRRQIATAVETIVAALRRRGRLFFVGAGTSGRLGVLEAAECPPTFGTPRRLVQAIIAGDRKSTRLNSSHLVISYAVFCLKKKKKTTN